MDVIAAIVSICSNNNPAGIAAAQQRATDAGIVMVFPAGNGAADGCTNAPYPPSGYLGGPGVIGVTAVRKSFSGTLESPSNYQYGTTVDFAAPTEVLTTSPAGGTFTFAGTSAAAPHVAGLAALLVKAGYRGHDAILFRLQYGARHVPSGGRNDYFGYGFVNSIGSLINRPSAVSIEGAPPPITTAGTYSLTAPIAFGAGPSNVKWRIVYSNGVLPTVETGFVSSPYALQVPSGSYSITVTATPKESAYLQRTGAGYQTDIPVCTGGAGSSPDAPGGCGGGGGGEM